MIKNILIFVLSSFVIGNTVAWFSGAAPINFAPIAYSETEQQQMSSLKAAIKRDESDADAQLALGQLYSYHNDIDLARPPLLKALQTLPDSPLAQAAYYANDGMLAGASVDFTMGIYKTIRLRTAMEKINDAAQVAEQDFSVRLVRLVTFSYVGEYGGLFDEVFKDEAWFNQLFEQAGKDMPAAIKQTAWIALAHVYLNQVANSEENMKVGKKYYAMASALGPCPTTLQPSCSQLGTMSVVSGGL